MKPSPRTVWIGMIVGLLSLSVGVNLFVLFVFAGSPSETLEENWEQRSEDWDAIQRQNTVNRELGWSLKVKQWEAASDPSKVTLQLLDRDQNPLSGARVQLMAYHRAHPEITFRGQAIEGEAGLYQFEIPSPKEGYFEFRAELVHEGQAFTPIWQEYFTPAVLSPTK